MTKSQLRNQMLAQLAHDNAREEKARKIITSLTELPCFQDAGIIISYVAIREEVPTQPVIERALKQRKKVFVPYCRGEDIHLFQLNDLSELTRGAYGVPEPPAELRQDRRRCLKPTADLFCKEGQCAENEMGKLLVIVPGVAFDSHGGRLGRGKGYYDRFLAKLPQNSLFIALAFHSQILSALPIEPHDIKVHQIVTERGVIRC